MCTCIVYLSFQNITCKWQNPIIYAHVGIFTGRYRLKQCIQFKRIHFLKIYTVVSGIHMNLQISIRQRRIFNKLILFLSQCAERSMHSLINIFVFSKNRNLKANKADFSRNRTAELC